MARAAGLLSFSHPGFGRSKARAPAKQSGRAYFLICGRASEGNAKQYFWRWVAVAAVAWSWWWPR